MNTLTIEEVYSIYWKKMLYQVCRKYTKNMADAEDLCQNAFIKIKDNLHRYENTGPLEGWLRRIIINMAIDDIRKRKIEFCEEVDWEIIEKKTYTHTPLLSDDFTIEDVERVKNNLTPRKLEVFNLILEGYKHKEIAAKLNISEGHSKATFHRAKKSLKKLLLNGVK